MTECKVKIISFQNTCKISAISDAYINEKKKCYLWKCVAMQYGGLIGMCANIALEANLIPFRIYFNIFEEYRASEYSFGDKIRVCRETQLGF